MYEDSKQISFKKNSGNVEAMSPSWEKNIYLETKSS